MVRPKLSGNLASLITSKQGHAHTPAPADVYDLFRKIAGSASFNKIGPRPWVVLAAATATTLNSPDGLIALHHIACTKPIQNASRKFPFYSIPLASTQNLDPILAAELIREAGLKCTSFIGFPRTAACLGYFRAQLHPSFARQLSIKPSRHPGRTATDAAETYRRGFRLFTNVYGPLKARNLIDRFSGAHPDLPAQVITNNYGPLLADPPGTGEGLARLGRVLTSVVAIACLRAQGGAGEQVYDQVVGLKMGVEGILRARERAEVDSEVFAETTVGEEGMEWLASDQGCEWMLTTVDGLVAGFKGVDQAGDGVVKGVQAEAKAKLKKTQRLTHDARVDEERARIDEERARIERERVERARVKSAHVKRAHAELKQQQKAMKRRKSTKDGPKDGPDDGHIPRDILDSLRRVLPKW